MSKRWSKKEDRVLMMAVGREQRIGKAFKATAKKTGRTERAAANRYYQHLDNPMSKDYQGSQHIQRLIEKEFSESLPTKKISFWEQLKYVFKDYIK